MKYHLKNKFLEGQLNTISDGEFSKRLQEKMEMRKQFPACRRYPIVDVVFPRSSRKPIPQFHAHFFLEDIEEVEENSF